MKKAFKSLIIKVLLKFNKHEWSSSKAFRILIQTNAHFNKTGWEKVIMETNLLQPGQTEIQYTDSKITFLKLFAEADVCFSFGLSSYVQLTEHSPRYLYFATVGTEFLGNRSFPANYQFGSPAGISSEAIAEYVLAMSLVMNRNLTAAFNNQFNYRWDQEQLLDKPFRPINQLSIGILGMGKNGKAIAGKFKALGCKVSGCDQLRDESLQLDSWFQPDHLAEMFSKVNLAVISVPLTNNTKGIIDMEKLECLGKEGYLINVSRGDVMVEKDLVHALENGIIAGAVTDVCSKEPVSPGHRLWSTRNLVITPHIAGNINLFIPEIMNDFLEKSSQFIGKNV
jgi:phosphoglycerate dehydrogenase-like enzyme